MARQWPQVVYKEEGMREGMQIEDSNIPVEDKVRLLDALSETGLKTIVVGSFVSPKWTPQMTRIDEVVSKFHPKPGVKYTALAVNARGVERAREYSPPLTIERGPLAPTQLPCLRRIHPAQLQPQPDAGDGALAPDCGPSPRAKRYRGGHRHQCQLGLQLPGRLPRGCPHALSGAPTPDVGRSWNQGGQRGHGRPHELVPPGQGGRVAGAGQGTMA